MSTEMYPIALGSVRVTPFNRVLSDEFESGVTNRRRLWGDQTFKRRFALSHPNLTKGELRALQSFYHARNGAYDPFYFRDNLHREGNHAVTFTGFPDWSADGGSRNVDVVLQETSPRRALPSIEELTTATGTAPLLWWDANRERALRHVDSWAYDGSDLWNAATWAAGGVWQAGSIGFGSSLAAAYQHYRADGTCWAKTAANLVISGGVQPACTLFAVVRHSTIAAKQVLLSVGTVGAGQTLGLAVAADNRYEPWIGAGETWTNARSNNSAADTWRSVAIVWAASSNTATLYVNAVSIGADSVARSYSAGPATLFAASDGTLKSGSGLSMADVQHAVVINAACTLGQVKALHNLLGYQAGLAEVA